MSTKDELSLGSTTDAAAVRLCLAPIKKKADTSLSTRQARRRSASGRGRRSLGVERAARVEASGVGRC